MNDNKMEKYIEICNSCQYCVDCKFYDKEKDCLKSFLEWFKKEVK